MNKMTEYVTLETGETLNEQLQVHKNGPLVLYSNYMHDQEYAHVFPVLLATFFVLDVTECCYQRKNQTFSTY